MTETKIIICVGSGGVGKTTIASILGLHHALKGQKTLVITVDPARRLLDALDIAERGHMPKAIDIKRLTKREPKKGGALFALMPDLAHEWLDFLKASVSREKIRHEISSNHFYRYMADGLPGGLEIICSHILFRLWDASAFDTIILDTPPSSHSLTFFAVPERIVRVLEQSVFRTLVQKRASILLKLAKKLAFFSGGLLQKTLERIVG
ncbi:MAG TPA: ArsA-related P-loop ATPase, partial [Myxococcota bacterium]|nr:ArsA-related P-loop ATPase [Myxococcota bacterium]